MNKSMISENKGIMLVLLCVFALMLVLNSMTPLFADDYIYLLNLQTEEPIKSFGDILVSVSGFRNMHNGRVVAHFFAQLFLWLPKPVFVFVNSAMCTALMLLIYRFTKSEDKTKDAYMLALAFAMLWVLMMGFGHAVLWRTGACSYLWAAVFIAAYIYPFFKCYMDQSIKFRGAIPAVIGIAYAFFAGSYSESGGFSALAIAFCFLVLIFIKERILPKWLLANFFSGCAGFLWLMLAPSELGKKNISSDSQTLEQLDKIGINAKVIVLAVLAVVIAAIVLVLAVRKNRRNFCKFTALAVVAVMLAVVLVTALDLEKGLGFLPAVNSLMSDTVLGLVLLFGTYAAILCMYLTREEIDIKLVISAVVLGIGALASIAVFLVADYFPARATCVTTVYLTIANVLLLSAVYKSKTYKISAVIIILMFILTLVAGCTDIAVVSKQYQQRKEVISQAQADGLEEIKLAPLLAQGKFCVAWQREAADYLFAMETYYGIDKIEVEGARSW